MNLPGLSLFQGAGSLHLNTSAQRLEEEEELLDQQRRREEVQKDLDKEFGDLSDDNDETTTSNGQSFNVPEKLSNGFGESPHVLGTHNPINSSTNKLNGMQSNYRVSDPNERENLMLRFKEQQELEDLRKRLSLCESEKQRAFMAKQQTHELLVESKEKISDQADMIQKLKTKMKGLEQKNTDLENELEFKKTMLSDAELKARLIERNIGVTSERNADMLVKQTNDRCNAQMELMQQQIDGLRNQLDEKAHEVKTLNNRYTELQRSREAILVEKSETINQLSKSVEDSQRQCHQLMANNEGRDESIRLKATVHQLTSEVESMHKTISNLERSLQTANAELDSMTCILNESSDPSHHKNHRNGIIPNSTPIHDVTTRLKNELTRCMEDQRERRKEFKVMQQTLDTKEAELKTLREDENKLLIEVERLQVDAKRMNKRVKILQEDLSRLFKLHGRQESADEDYPEKIIDDIENEFTALQSKYAEATRQQESISRQLSEVKNERNLLENRLLELSATRDSDLDDQPMAATHLRQVQDECHQLRQKFSELSTSKEEIANELAALRKLNLDVQLQERLKQIDTLNNTIDLSNQRYTELQNQLTQERINFTQQLKELNDKCLENIQPNQKMVELQAECIESHRIITDLQVRLQQAQDTANDLRQTVAMKHDNDKLLADLQEKARNFDQFIHMQTAQQKSPPPGELEKRCSSAPQQSSPSNRKDEERMAKVLAAKLKKIEDAATAQLQKFKQSLQRVELELQQTKDTLTIRSGEVQMLKQAILAERAKSKEIMEDRDTEIGELFEKQQSILDKYRERLDGAQTSIEKLNERIAQLNGERKSACSTIDQFRLEKEKWRIDRENWTDDKNQWLLEREQVCLNENHLRNRICELESAQQKLIAEWQIKYKQAKKTAANYKKYAEEKDLHIAKENIRIQQEYDLAVKKMHEKVVGVIKDR